MNYEIYPIKIAEEGAPGPVIYYLNNFGEEATLADLMWLIKGGEHIILVDTGFTPKEASKFEPDSPRDFEQHPVEQLRNLGVEPEEVTHIIITHCHFDHLSPLIFEYEKAQIFIQKRELEFASHPPHPWFSGLIDGETVKKLSTDCKNRLRLVEGGAEVLPGITVFWTGGHTPGHQSVKVTTTKGRAIVSGDVVFTYRNIEEDIPVGVLTDLEECYSAMKRIRKEADIVLPGHENLVFERYGNKIPAD